MSSTTPALLAAAAGVGFAHAVLPDHWLPLAVVGRTQRYPLARVMRLSAVAAIAHVVASLILGGVIIALGLQFRSEIRGAQDAIVGAILILTGLAFAALELTGQSHTHGPGGHTHGSDAHSHDHVEHSHAHTSTTVALAAAADESAGRRLTTLMVALGAAASPDLTVLPVFLAATTAGVVAAVGALVAFSVATILSIVGLTLFACFGGHQIQGSWIERWANPITASVLVVIGVLVLIGAV